MITTTHKIEDGVCLRCGRHCSDMFEIKCMEISMIFCTTCFKQNFGHYSIIDTASSGWKYWYAIYMETRKICPNCGKVLDNTIQICTKCTYRYKIKR